MILGIIRGLRAATLKRPLDIASRRIEYLPTFLRQQQLYMQARFSGGTVLMEPHVRINHFVRFQGRGRLVINSGVVFGFHMAGSNTMPIILQPRETQSTIVIGQGSQIMNGCEFIARTAIEIGEDCLVGAQTTILDSDFHGLAPDARLEAGKTNPVFIGSNVWIGTKALILKGVRIGKDAVVAAGCVVTNDVPVGAIVAGNPMQIVGSVYTQT